MIHLLKCSWLYRGDGKCGFTISLKAGFLVLYPFRAGIVMVSFAISHVAAFMSKLLSSDCFDSFLLEEAQIRMAVTYSIDGKINEAFYDDAEQDIPAQRSYVHEPWSNVRGTVRSLLVGKKMPVSFQITLELKPEYLDKTLSSTGEVREETRNAVGALLINIRFVRKGNEKGEEAASTIEGKGQERTKGEVMKKEEILLVTGVSMKQFVADKSPDRVWDRTMERFLASKGIEWDRKA